MSKADERDKGTGSEGSVKNAAETTPDVIPPVHVLEAAQQQERKETEDLLAGFDRPGRSPRHVPSGDFVDYYTRKKGDRVAPSPSERTTKPAAGRRDAATVIVPRKKQTPGWVMWAGAAAVLLTLGASVAYIATSDAPTPPPPSAPSAATTITSAPPVATQTSSIVDVPPPDPLTTATTNPTVVTADPIATVRTAPKPRASVSASAWAPPPPVPSSTSPSPSSSNGYIRTFPTP